MSAPSARHGQMSTHNFAISAYSLGVGFGCCEYRWVAVYRMNRAFSNGDILFMSMAASTSVGNAFGNEKVVFFRLPICIIVNEALSHILFTQHVPLVLSVLSNHSLVSWGLIWSLWWIWRILNVQLILYDNKYSYPELSKNDFQSVGNPFSK